MKKYKSNNVVLIIGNGFDLAHDLDTKYSNFANWFLTKIEKEITNYLTTRDDTGFLNANFIRYFSEDRYKYVVFQPYKIINATQKYLGSNNETLNLLLKNNFGKMEQIISNSFLGKLYGNQYINWFDIENAYFQELINIKNKMVNNSNFVKSDNALYKKRDLINLNKDLIEIKNYLKEYLDTIIIEKNRNVEVFLSEIVPKFNELEYTINIVNFNYTDTIECYFSNFKNGSTNLKSVNINYIHGNLKDNNLIFGYGNDQHKEYREIKDLEINDFLENFKTFKYLDNNNYSRIYDDILDNNSIEDYVVFVLGHSLGATDKTLLEEIFNNEKCKQIHLFKRSDLKDNEEKLKKAFDELKFSASRILKNEKDLRKKILNYEDSVFFP